MKPFDILLPTKFETPKIMDCLRSFKWIPYDYRLHVITEGQSWTKAVNIGFRQTTRDVLLMDDDIEFLSNTFNSDFERYLEYADIIGFKLVFPNGRICGAGAIPEGGIVGPRYFGLPNHFQDVDQPAYMSHVTTSLIYIKRHVIDQIDMDEEYTGYLFEDVDFTWRAYEAGFKILYTPLTAVHLANQTKARFKDFEEGKEKNRLRLHAKFDDRWSKFSVFEPFELPRRKK